MSKSKIEFHRLEKYEFGDKYRYHESVICSFKTRNLGIYQVEYKKLENGWKLKQLPQEPDLHMLTDKQLLHIEKICRIVWRMVYDTPAAKSRFSR